MADVKTMVQTEVVIDGVVSLLAQDQNVEELIHRIEDATASTGRFVRMTVVGNREVHVLVTPTSRASITVATVLHDARDSGDIEFPYGGFYDPGFDG
ncbi:hypothetical protein J7E45_11445 [Microbacterium sp. ISL-59]|uniref:hypothetical protein n=1 Tax=Microbacterium sp. ISL-59 TaxID=2819159 RepID=UPI001BE50C9D|nr:hypothetical protein [Microbacterium sp. ISL-59]MBT2496222.1 hypothetical protein [Microbacterium sp. ISL-59]